MIKNWLDAFRLRTLPLSISGILMGSFLAFEEGFVDLGIFTFAIITTILFQILSNLANDLGDSIKGTDNIYRLGPARTVQSGLISKRQMKNAVILNSVLSMISAGFLVYLSKENMPSSLIIGYGILTLCCVAAAILYTISSYAYGYKGLGDIMVLIFFGVIGVLGTFTLYTKEINLSILLPSFTIGTLSMAVLNLNNLRDHENDSLSGKMTLIVQLGYNNGKIYHYFLLLVSFLSLFTFGIIEKKHGILIALIPYTFLFQHIIYVSKCKQPKELDSELKKVALITFSISLLSGIGMWLI
jgi:1,4-dihydroxy-2-naphthoate octaprenyltransferase